MGRDAKRKAATLKKFTLEKADFFELRTLIRDVEAVELDALRAANAFKQRAAEAESARNRKVVALGTQYGFDPDATYRWDDATCTLIEIAPAPAKT